MERIYTGFESIDKSLQMDMGDLVVIGSIPAMGKTAFLISLLNNFSRNDIKCKFFSLELDEKNLSAKILKSTCNDKEREKAIFSNTAFNYETFFTKGKFEAEIDKNVRVVLIDYLQLLDINGLKSKEKIEILKEIAVRKNVVIIIASQISRAFETYDFPPKISAEMLLNKKELLNNFAMESIDKFVFIDRPKRRLFCDIHADDGADFVVLKNNNGNTFSVECGLDNDTYTFKEITEKP